MPNSRKRKPKKQVATRAPFDPSKMVFQKMDFGIGDRHAEFKQAVLKSAREDVEKYPALLDQLFGMLKGHMPESVLSTFGFYGTRATMNDKGETRTLAKGIEQHHIELLQGIALTLPAAEWGEAPSTAEVMQTVFDIVPQISDTIFKRRLIAAYARVCRTLAREDRRARRHAHGERAVGVFKSRPFTRQPVQVRRRQ